MPMLSLNVDDFLEDNIREILKIYKSISPKRAILIIMIYQSITFHSSTEITIDLITLVLTCLDLTSSWESKNK